MKKILLSLILAAFLLAPVPTLITAGNSTQTQLIAGGDGGDYGAGGG